MSQVSRSKAAPRGSRRAASSDEEHREGEARGEATRQEKMRNLWKGLALTGPGDLKIILEARIDGSGPIGPRWVVKDAMGADTDEIPESELVDETLWR